jgi:hypothetical protein
MLLSAERALLSYNSLNPFLSTVNLKGDHNSGSIKTSNFSLLLGAKVTFVVIFYRDEKPEDVIIQSRVARIISFSISYPLA